MVAIIINIETRRTTGQTQKRSDRLRTGTLCDLKIIVGYGDGIGIQFGELKAGEVGSGAGREGLINDDGVVTHRTVWIKKIHAGHPSVRSQVINQIIIKGAIGRIGSCILIGVKESDANHCT